MDPLDDWASNLLNWYSGARTSLINERSTNIYGDEIKLHAEVEKLAAQYQRITGRDLLPLSALEENKKWIEERGYDPIP